MQLKIALLVFLVGLFSFEAISADQRRTSGCSNKGCRMACNMFQTDENGCRLCKCCYSEGSHCVSTQPKESLEDLIKKLRQGN